MYGDQHTLDPELEYNGPRDKTTDTVWRLTDDIAFRDIVVAVRVDQTHTPSQADAFSQEGSKLLIGGF